MVDSARVGNRLRRAPRSKWGRDKRVGLFLFLPVVFVMLTLALYPIVRTIGFSLFDVDVFLNDSAFVGLDNFETVLTSSVFWSALWNDVVYTVGSIVIEIVFGILVALLLNRYFVGRGVVRSMVLFSYLVPIVVAALVWRFMLNDVVGILTPIVEALNLPIPTTWLASPRTAMATVIGISVWKFYPFMVIIFLAQLQSIDPQLRDAAKVDGASIWQEFRYITLPTLMPVIIIAAMLRGIFTFNDFSTIQLLTGGGPVGSTETPPILIFDTVFTEFDLGRGAAMAVVMFLVLAVMSLGYIKLHNRAQKQLTE